MSTNIRNLDFGSRILQKVKGTSFVVVVPRPLVIVLQLKVGDRLNFVLNEEGTITLRREEVEQ